VLYRERKNIDEESTNKVLATNRSWMNIVKNRWGRRNSANVKVIYAANK
jgi:hypothetical protein